MKMLYNELNNLLEPVYSDVKADRISVFTVNPKDHIFNCIYSQDILGEKISCNQGILGLSFLTGNSISICVNSCSNFKGCYYNFIDTKYSYCTKSILSIPIKNNLGNVVYIIQAINKLDEDCFNNHDESLLLSLSSKITETLISNGYNDINSNDYNIDNCLDITLDISGNVLTSNFSLLIFFGLQNYEKFNYHYSSFLNSEVSIELLSDINDFFVNGNNIVKELIQVKTISGPVLMNYHIYKNDNNQIIVSLKPSKWDNFGNHSKYALLSPPFFKPPSDLYTWEFDVTLYADSDELHNIIGTICCDMLNFNTLGINSAKLGSFLRDVAALYHSNPFHNLQHSACVTHFVAMLMRTIKCDSVLSIYQYLSIIISAIGHDIDHPANTNAFEVNTKSPLALLYNNQAVLENHHSNQLLLILSLERNNFIGTLAVEHQIDIRKTINSCILATDMSVHFQLVDKCKTYIDKRNDYLSSHDDRYTSINIFNDVSDKLFLCQILVHAADLSNPVRPFHMTKKWAERVSEEFNEQVKLETELGLPILPHMITKNDLDLCKNETGFATFVVLPMWSSISGVFPILEHLPQQIEKNKLEWKKIQDNFVDNTQVDK